MAAKQYTECVQPDDYVDLSGTAVGFRNILILLLSGLFTAWLIAIFVGGPPYLIGAIALFTTIVIYLTWWLHGRLICLGRECLVGVVTGAGPSDPAEKGGDNDFTMGLSFAAMAVAAAGYLPPVYGALLQEGIDVAVIINALRALKG